MDECRLVLIKIEELKCRLNMLIECARILIKTSLSRELSRNSTGLLYIEYSYKITPSQDNAVLDGTIDMLQLLQKGPLWREGCGDREEPLCSAIWACRPDQSFEVALVFYQDNKLCVEHTPDNSISLAALWECGGRNTQRGSFCEIRHCLLEVSPIHVYPIVVYVNQIHLVVYIFSLLNVIYFLGSSVPVMCFLRHG